MYILPEESTSIDCALLVASPPVKYTYETSAPDDELYFSAYIELIDTIGKLDPDAVGATPNVFIGTAVDEMYAPVTYMF
jgi:hypothetical protein